ncbi:hypothetical protein RFI_07558 [Reticulomyxa filosa]|uniref:Uncharacterized protein n=1 Tax=Reticulomyxa filosa TaxID=46433 RepID=X6NU78_RETFI|nr:hypothetical protein RFI_07558 [Reticulomyxa filosa]|eukprot:ETO29566.1 hypothetical protein RFI_07558 [Reticulomyxa filosa]
MDIKMKGALKSDVQLDEVTENLPESLLHEWTAKFKHGTAHVLNMATQEPELKFEEIPTFSEFLQDVNDSTHWTHTYVQHTYTLHTPHSTPHIKKCFIYILLFKKWISLLLMGEMKGYRRLQMLEARFDMHLLLNDEIELKECRQVPYRDLYNIRKVDNHIDATCSLYFWTNFDLFVSIKFIYLFIFFLEKHLLSFMRDKLRKEPDTVVTKDENGKSHTLKEVFDNIGISPDDLSITLLDVLSGEKNTRHKTEYAQIKQNLSFFFFLPKCYTRVFFLKCCFPFFIFLEVDNVIKGRYFAELTQEVFADLDWSKYTKLESRLSIYGTKSEEWQMLAEWICQYKLQSEHVRWVIQIPRLYHVYRSRGLLQSFGQMLENIFLPLFQVTIDPSSNPAVCFFFFPIIIIMINNEKNKYIMWYYACK